MVDLEEIKLVLRNFVFQNKAYDFYALGVVEDVVIRECVVGCVLKNTLDNVQAMLPYLEKRMLEVAGVAKVNIVITDKKQERNKQSVAGIENIIMVSAGKGGVGKSTIAFFTALSLAKKGLRVGLLDADVYGPSIPTMTSHHEKPEIVNETMIPHVFKGVKFNSIGYLIPNDKALAWRGPMISKVLHQLLLTTAWGELDYLIIDMPPGTGDIHLTLCDKYKIDGVVMVSIPHELAVADVARAVDMYRKFSLPIIGLVKNMSFLEVDGKKHCIFGDGQALDSYVKSQKIKVISEIPVLSNIDNTSLVTGIIDAISDSTKV